MNQDVEQGTEQSKHVKRLEAKMLSVAQCGQSQKASPEMKSANKIAIKHHQQGSQLPASLQHMMEGYE